MVEAPLPRDGSRTSWSTVAAPFPWNLCGDSIHWRARFAPSPASPSTVPPQSDTNSDGDLIPALSSGSGIPFPICVYIVCPCGIVAASSCLMYVHDLCRLNLGKGRPALVSSSPGSPMFIEDSRCFKASVSSPAVVTDHQPSRLMNQICHSLHVNM
jgi:hypothetical protein